MTQIDSRNEELEAALVRTASTASHVIQNLLALLGSDRRLKSVDWTKRITNWHDVYLDANDVLRKTTQPDQRRT